MGVVRQRTINVVAITAALFLGLVPSDSNAAAMAARGSALALSLNTSLSDMSLMQRSARDAGFYTVIVGKFGDTDSTNGFVKAVEVPYHLDCPLTLGKNLWENGEPDTFSVAVDGTTVTVTRTDRATAWGMNLQFTCAIKGT